MRSEWEASPRELRWYRVLSALCAASGLIVAIAFSFHVTSDLRDVGHLALFAGVVALTWAMVFAMRR